MDTSRPTTPTNQITRPAAFGTPDGPLAMINNRWNPAPPRFRWENQINTINARFHMLSEPILVAIRSVIQITNYIPTYTLQNKPFAQWHPEAQEAHFFLAEKLFSNTGFENNMRGVTMPTLNGTATIIIRFLDEN